MQSKRNVPSPLLLCLCYADGLSSPVYFLKESETQFCLPCMCLFCVRREAEYLLGYFTSCLYPGLYLIRGNPFCSNICFTGLLYTIRLAYESKGLQPPKALKDYSAHWLFCQYLKESLLRRYAGQPAGLSFIDCMWLHSCWLIPYYGWALFNCTLVFIHCFLNLMALLSVAPFGSQDSVWIRMFGYSHNCG